MTNLCACTVIYSTALSGVKPRYEYCWRIPKLIANTDSVLAFLAFLDREHFLFAVWQTPILALEVMTSYSDHLRHLRHILSALDGDISK